MQGGVGILVGLRCVIALAELICCNCSLSLSLSLSQGRYPVFLPNGTDPSQPPGPNDTFFAFVSSLILVEQVVTLGNLQQLTEQGLDFQLRVLTPQPQVRWDCKLCCAR